jgi:hypothetical protein
MYTKKPLNPSCAAMSHPPSEEPPIQRSCGTVEHSFKTELWGSVETLDLGVMEGLLSGFIGSVETLVQIWIGGLLDGFISFQNPETSLQ